MYRSTGAAIPGLAGAHARPPTWRRVTPNVWFLGITSLLTDISSEMVASILPLYLVMPGHEPVHVRGDRRVYPGITALVRWVGGIAGDRMKRHKELAAAGYAVSAVSRSRGWWSARTRHGSPRPSPPTAWGKVYARAARCLDLAQQRAEDLGPSFGVHRAMDAAGAMLGPLTAFVILAMAPQRFDLIFIVSFGMGLIGLAVLLLFVSNPAADAPPPARSTAPAGSSRHSCDSPGCGPRSPSSSALAAVTISDAFIYLTLQRQGLVSASAIPLLYVGTNCVYLLLAVPFGALSDRTARWKCSSRGTP